MEINSKGRGGIWTMTESKKFLSTECVSSRAAGVGSSSLVSKVKTKKAKDTTTYIICIFENK